MAFSDKSNTGIKSIFGKKPGAAAPAPAAPSAPEWNNFDDRGPYNKGPGRPGKPQAMKAGRRKPSAYA